MKCCSREWTSLPPPSHWLSKAILKSSATSRWVKTLPHQEERTWPSSSMISICLRLIIGEIKRLWKLSDSWSTMEVSIGWTSPWEETSRMSRTSSISGPWISQEVVGMTFQTESKDNSLSSTWFYLFRLKSSILQSSNTSSSQASTPLNSTKL